MELAVGMFTIALIVGALFHFVRYIARSLEIENHIRKPGQGTYADSIRLEDFAANEIFGMKNLHIKEPRGVTDRTIQ